MRIETGQHLRLDQRMKLAPRMIQSMEILQMTTQALEARIEQELSSNPTLELREAGTDAQELDDERSQHERDDREGERELVVNDESGPDKNNADDFERLTNISEEYGDSWAANTSGSAEGYRAPRPTGERDGKLDAMANAAARTESLAEQLLAQWVLIETDPITDAAGRYLIDFIDDDGYLRTEMDTLIAQAPSGIGLAELDAARQLVQTTMEPVGIGARDVRECLLLQIDAAIAGQGDRSSNGHADHDYTIERRLVNEFLKDIETNRLPRIAKATGWTIDQIKQGILSLRRYRALPGRALVEDRSPMVIPEAAVEYDEETDRYVARLTNDRLPSIQINASYQKMARDRSVDSQTRQFVGNNLRSASWLLDAINQRQSTLLRVISVVIEAQREFFDHGPQYLKPLPMTLVADQLGIHVATVSRAVSEKYIQTPRGILPLRMFFSGGTETESGDQMSWAAIQAKLEQIINEEDKSCPLSDDLLAEKLSEAGIEIARRTVAKYRKQLNIPPARQRREY